MPAKKKAKGKKGGSGGGGGGKAPNAAAAATAAAVPEDHGPLDLTVEGHSVQVDSNVDEAAPDAAPAPAPVDMPAFDRNGYPGLPAVWPPKELNEFVTLEEEQGKRYPVRGNETQYVQYEQYSSFDEMQDIIDMMSADLSEPYPIFTYRYFIDSWPDLCWLAKLRDTEDPTLCKMVGAITCKSSVAPKDPTRIRGYVAMLAVHQDYRNNGFGSKLVRLAVDTMKKKGCTEVVLETEIGNSGALNLYEGLGFVRDKRLDKYYQHGTDAFRLKLWLKPPACFEQSG